MVKKYKQKINALKKDKEKLAKKLGEVMVERDWAVGKLKSLDLLTEAYNGKYYQQNKIAS
ncbi:hypothetical protein M1N78_03585 [Peptococcaceae bacterium]|nr:hypothetical protein [Peptococcaceae bacterium]